MHYEARIIENGKARYAECGEHTPGDALLYLVQAANVRKGAIVQFGSAMWEGDRFVSGVTTYRHMPERDNGRYSAWELVGTDHVEYLNIIPK